MNLQELLPYLPAGILFVWLLANAWHAANKLRKREAQLGATINDLKRELTLSRESAAESLRMVFDLFPTSVLVVDPNDDRIRRGNLNSHASGFEVGKAVSGYIHDADRPLYEKARASSDPGTRACTVRLAKGGGHALIRSAVAAVPMADLKIQANDRLVSVDLLSAAEADFIAMPVRVDERTRLGSLLKHGLARMAGLAARNPKLDPRIQRWLLTYVEQRVQVISALMAGWGHALEALQPSGSASPPTKAEQGTPVSKFQVLQMLDNLRWLASFVATSRDIRQEWEWGNGVLSDLSPGQPPFSIGLEEWPDNLDLKSSIPGVPYFILEELLINTFKHGSPGEPADLTATLVEHLPERCIEFRVASKIAKFDRLTTESARPYGGQVLIREACRRLGWVGPEVQRSETEHVVTIRAPI